MKKRLFAAFAGSVLLLLVSSPLLAHHAGSLYDREHPVTLTGTVTKYLMINPHAQIHFEVKKDDGTVETWVAETAGPQRLLRVGWNKNTLKAGDTITVTGAQFKDGRKYLSIYKLTGGNAPVLTEGAE
jgi:hypothetical protein